MRHHWDTDWLVGDIQIRWECVGQDSVNCTLVAAHGGVATPWNSRLFRVVAPCPVPPQTPPSCRPTDLFRINNTLVDIDFEENDASTIQLMEIDNKVRIDAKRNLALHYGKLSVTLHPNGKIVLWGDYTLSDTEVVSRIADDWVVLKLSPASR